MGLLWDECLIRLCPRFLTQNNKLGHPYPQRQGILVFVGPTVSLLFSLVLSEPGSSSPLGRELGEITADVETSLFLCSSSPTLQYSRWTGSRGEVGGE